MSFAPDSVSSLSDYTAVFGGTFDPPHLGHREALFGLFRNPGISRVKVIPAGLPPLKSSGTSAEHRFAMAKLGLGAEGVESESIDFDDREIARESSGKPSYSFDTLSELRSAGLRFAFVIGADQLETLPRWHRFPELLKLCPWIILERKPAGAARIARMLAELEASGLVRRISDRKCELPGQQWLLQVQTDARDLSSTEIRREMSLKGEVPRGVLHPKVAAYLKAHRLYGMKEEK